MLMPLTHCVIFFFAVKLHFTLIVLLRFPKSTRLVSTILLFVTFPQSISSYMEVGTCNLKV